MAAKENEMNNVDVIVREVGLRDGLQIHPTFMPTASKIAWIEAEAAAGVSEIEVTSYVPPKLIPQFVDAEEVTRRALAIPGLTVAALIPNYKGAERGLALGVHKLNFVMSVSKTHNLKNVRREREESVADFRKIVELVKAQPEGRRPRVVGGLSTALGCSFEGRIPVADVVRYARLLAEVGSLPVAAHFHDTRGTGLANVSAALECGVRSFDASLAGLGGCPFAPGVTGNIVMDDLCFMLDSMGLTTGVDLEKLLAVREIVRAALPDIEMHGALARAGLPRNYVPASARRAA